MRALPRHDECSAVVQATAEELFEHLDDHTRLSSHMRESSWAMGGGHMDIGMDANRGRAIGSRISLAGRVFGIRLAVDEVVTERVAPRRKVWETVGRPRLLVIGDYRMGFDIVARNRAAALEVFIDYTLPDDLPARWLARLLSRYYARWCTRRIVDDAATHFSRSAPPRAFAPS
jgi:hypothetical protein